MMHARIFTELFSKHGPHWAPILALLLFVVCFSGVCIYCLRLNKNELKKYEELLHD